MLVYVLNKDGKPLMPCSPRKARKLLKEEKAVIVKKEPFTIKLKHGSSGHKQSITLGVDAGSKIIGISASGDKKELFVAEVHLRNNIVELLSTKRQYRRTRRGRLRYRKSRFLNRVKSKRKGWIAPSIENKIDSHIKIIDKIHQILPISKIIIEVASFDIQKIKNPEISGVEYQRGEKLGFWNIRQYVLARDNYKCQGKKECPNKKLRVHHLESRKIGGDRPDNQITLCAECHDLYHKGKLELKIKKSIGFRNAAHMNIMRHGLLNKLKQKYKKVEQTFGYITSFNRIQNKLEKGHINDARCITGNFNIKFLDYSYLMKFVRKNNRKLHKSKILKGGIKKNNKSPYEVKGFRLFDKVDYNGIHCFIFGRRATGAFNIRKLNGKVLKSSINYKKLKLIDRMKTLLVEICESTLENNI